MSRESLRPLHKLRRRFEGTFVRFGQKHFKEHYSTTVLLKDIKESGSEKVLTDHVWLNLTKQIAEQDLKEGDVISFDARVRMYPKGYRGYESKDEGETWDFKLSHPTNVRLKSMIGKQGEWFDEEKQE